MLRIVVRTGSAVAAALVSLAVACGPSPGEPAAGARVSRSAVISDQAHGGEVPGFFWLPPMAPTTAYGTFAPGLAPRVVIDSVPPGASPVASFLAAEVKTDAESHYMVTWDTKASSLDPAVTYRIRVVLGGVDLGYADVDVVSSGSELRRVDGGQYVPLLDGRTLPVKFRVQPEALKCVDVVCQPLDPCHVAGKCDPLTGVCSNPAQTDGVTCDDGDRCTQTDTCQAGACQGANPVVCEALDQCHDAGACEPATGACSNPAKPEGTECDDADLCTQVDTCRAGVCTGLEPVTCTALDECHEVGACDALTGLCPDPEKANGTPCDDENACTQLDTCQGGACTGWAPVICTASDQCHEAGVCDPAFGTCSNPERPNGASCDDRDACTQIDACLAGACAGGDPVICRESDQCHVAGTCDPATGGCSNPPKADGTPCDDGSRCTAAAACDGGRHYCTPADVCTDGVCPRTKLPCIDGLCTDCCSAADACVAGVCRGYAFSCDRAGCWGTGLTCDDGDPCTRNGCDPAAPTTGAVSGCAYVPDETLDASCAPPPEPGEPTPATVSIVGMAPATTGLSANQRLNFSVTLLATCEVSPCDRVDYDVELLLFPVTAEDDENEYPGIPLGTWRIPLVTEGEHEYLVELEIPEALQPGSWEISGHEYPTGAFYPGVDDPRVVVVVAGDPELPVLDVTALQVAQAGLFVDPESAVADPAIYRELPFAVNLEVVARNFGATNVPVTAHLQWGTEEIPLRIWEPATAGAAGRWVGTLLLTPPVPEPPAEPSPWALDADAPTSVYLELALASADAARVATAIGAEPVEAKVVVTVNGDRSVPEAKCAVSDPEAPLSCRHTAEVDALVWVAPPLPQQDAGPMAMALAAGAEPQVRRFEKSWSKSIGNDWARAGIAFSGHAQLSTVGYEASARANVPIRLFVFPEFQFIDANAFGDALVEAPAGRPENEKAHVRVSVQILGINAVDPIDLAGSSLEVDIGDLVELPNVQKEKKYERTVIVYVVPVTFTLGASAEVGLEGTITASFAAGGTLADQASLVLSGGPYATAEAFGGAALGVAFLSAGARVTLTLLDAHLTATAGGTLTFAKTPDLRPYEISGSLQETLSYATSFLNGRVGLTVTYPTIRWCKVWRFRFPCGFRLETKEAVLCSWPGFSYGGELLNETQDLFTIDVCEPNRSCAGLCGEHTDGCHPCTCPDGVPCDATAGTCGCVPPGMCDGRCGTVADACGAALECGACPGGLVCNAEQRCVACVPRSTCDAGSCGAVPDGCGGTLACGGCPSGQACSANVCVPTGFAYAGSYDVQHRWGAEYGTWLDETGDSRAQDITVHADGRVFRGGLPIVDPTFAGSTLSWSMASGNTTDGKITFKDGSTNTYVWGATGRTGVLFEAPIVRYPTAPEGIRFSGEGWLDFRGVRTCVPTTTCAGKCGTVFDGCSAVQCGACTCVAPDYLDTCGTCIDRDAAPPAVLYTEAMNRWMDPSCPLYELPRPLLVEEATALTLNYPWAISDAWVYLHDPSGAIVGSIRTNPQNAGMFERTEVFTPPIAVSRIGICSWWNPAYLLRLDLSGDPAACTP